MYVEPSFTVVGAVLSIVGASLTGVMVTVVVWVAHRSGFPPSQTSIERVQLAAGTGPAGVNVKTPVLATIAPPQVSVASTVQVWVGPPGSVTFASYVKSTSSVAPPGAVLITGATLVRQVPFTPGVALVSSQKLPAQLAL